MPELFVRSKVKTLNRHDHLIDLIHQLVSEGRYSEAQVIANRVRSAETTKTKN